MRAKIDEAMKALKPYQRKTTQSGKGKGFGKGWTDADHFGDKSLFAAGYDYDLGWDVEPVEVAGSDVCQLGGGARGGFGIDGWFINNRFEVVDALAEAHYARAADKTGYVHAHLSILEPIVGPGHSWSTCSSPPTRPRPRCSSPISWTAPHGRTSRLCCSTSPSYAHRRR